MSLLSQLLAPIARLFGIRKKPARDYADEVTLCHWEPTTPELKRDITVRVEDAALLPYFQRAADLWREGWKDAYTITFLPAPSLSGDKTVADITVRFATFDRRAGYAVTQDLSPTTGENIQPGHPEYKANVRERVLISVWRGAKGEMLSGREMEIAAVHETGHLFMRSHPSDTGSVMHATSKQTQPSPRDLATVKRACEGAGKG